MAKVSGAYESRSGTRARSTYRKKVRAALEALGHKHPEHEMHKSEAYIDRAERAGIDPKTTAVVLDMDPTRMRDREIASHRSEESATRDEWEVLVRGIDPKTQVAIGTTYPHTRSIGSSAVVVGDLYDDEKAARIASHITKKYGALVTYGPKAKIAAECSAMGSGEEVRKRRTTPRDPAEIADDDRYNDLFQQGRDQADRVFKSERFEIVRALEDRGRQFAMEKAAILADVRMDDGPMARGFEDAMRWKFDKLQNVHSPRSRYEAHDSGGPFTQIHRDPTKFAAVKERADAIGPLKNDRSLYDLLVVDLEKETQEVFYVATVDVHGQLLDYAEVARGQTDRVAVSTREIFAPVLLDKASGFAIAHNHPSGSARPSKADKELTDRIRDAAALVCPDVAFLDHLVVTGGEYYSFTSKKLVRVKR